MNELMYGAKPSRMANRTIFPLCIGLLYFFPEFVAASVLAPLRYISVPIGLIVGVHFFNELLSPTFFLYYK